MRLLLAEDEPDMNAILCKRFCLEGYGVDSCANGEDASAFLTAAQYDAVVLDVMMPQKSGLDVLRELRAKGDLTPVLLLTARDAVSDRVVGLDSGANDYLIKPFSFEELFARIRAMTRKAARQPSSLYTIANLTLDSAAHAVRRGDTPIELSSREFSVLEYLMRNQGIVLTREQIESGVWSFQYEGTSNVVDVYIRNLRRKIDDAYEPKLIHTIRGTGYVLRRTP